MICFVCGDLKSSSIEIVMSIWRTSGLWKAQNLPHKHSKHQARFFNSSVVPRNPSILKHVILKHSSSPVSVNCAIIWTFQKYVTIHIPIMKLWIRMHPVHVAQVKLFTITSHLWSATSSICSNVCVGILQIPRPLCQNVYYFLSIVSSLITADLTW